MMTIDQFENQIAAYGSKVENWPDDVRADMSAFCRDNAEAQAIMERAARLDAALDRRLDPASDDLQARILRDMDMTLADKALTDKTLIDKTLSNGQVLALPQSTAHIAQRSTVLAAVTAMAACFVGGFIAAPVIIDAFIGSADLMASLDIISDAFLPTEPL